jgi:hypothetical protein
LWEAYLREHRTRILAVARPHRHGTVGQKLPLDGSRSWSAAGKIDRYEWTFTDGTTATGPQVERTYSRLGTYSEILKVTDSEGRVDYDFAVVQILDPDPKKLTPTINASTSPTMGIKPGDPVTFKVRTFRTTEGSELWDFGDGSPRVTVHSDGCVKPLAPDGYAATIHRYEKPGRYVARVERRTNDGLAAVAHVKVYVGVDD